MMLKPLMHISSKQSILFALFLVLYEFLTYVANDMIMPGMLSVVQSFHASQAMIPTSLTVYIVGGASLQLLLGPLSDAYGRRPVMLFGAGLFFCFTLLIACSYSIESFLTARFFQGMGLCFIAVVGYATIQELFAEMDALRLVAIMANAGILAPLIGPLLGSFVIIWVSWRVIFLVIAFFALVALWGLWRYMPEPVGATLRDGRTIAKTPFSFCKIYKNYKALCNNPALIFSMLALGFVTGPCLVWIGLSPIILVTEAKLTILQYGFWQIPIFAACILGNWFLHVLTYRFSLKTIILISCVLVSLGLATTALLPTVFGAHYGYLMPGIILYFFALGTISGPLNRYALFITPVSKGTASALISLTSMLIEALSVEIASVLGVQHNNIHFGWYFLILNFLFLGSIGLSFYYGKSRL